MGKQKARVPAEPDNRYDEGAIDAMIQHLGLGSPKKASTEEKAEILREHFREIDARRGPNDPDSLITCDECGEDSLKDFDACPFCGVGEDPPADPGPPDGAVVPDPEDIPEGAGDEEPQAPEVQAELVVPPPGQKLVRLERPVPQSVGVANLTPLDHYVHEVKHLRNVAEVGGYLLAKKLAEGEVSGLWKTRLDAKQKPVYRNFDTFAQVELGMSAHYVRDQLALYRQFTEEEFRRIPPTKLRLIVQAHPDVKQAVREMAEAGAPRREIEQAMGRQPGSKPRAPKAAPEAKREKRPDGKVTVVLVEGRQKFAFHTRESAKFEKPKAARRIGEVPWARLPIAANDVEVLLTVTTNPKGEFVGVVEVRRK